MNADVISLSSTIDSVYLPYWPIVSEGWKRLFPNIRRSLTLVAVGRPSSSLVERLSNYGEVQWLEAHPDIPLHNQAKLGRMYAASEFQGQVTYLNDVDMLPLSADFYIEVLSKRVPMSLLQVGTEVYTEEPWKCPMPNTTAECSVFKALMNPNDLTFLELMASFRGMSYFSKKEDVTNTLPLGHPDGFSDESLLYSLLMRSDTTCTRVKRGVGELQALDKARWNLNPSKDAKWAHLPRPIDEGDNLGKIKELLVLYEIPYNTI